MVLNCVLNMLLPALCIADMYGIPALFGYGRRAKRIAFFAVGALFVAAGGLLSFLPDPETATLCEELLLLCAAIVPPYLCFYPQKKSTFFLLGLMLCAGMDFAECILLRQSAGAVRTTAVYCGLYAAVGLGILLCARYEKAKIIPTFPDRVPGIVFAVIFVADYSAYYTLTLRSNAESSPAVAVGLQYVSAVFSVCCIGFVIWRYVTLARLQKEDEERHALELERYEEMIRANQDVRAFRHDYKNDLLALRTFIESGRTQEAGSYIRDLTDTLEQTRGRYQTGNILADAILSDKAAKAVECGVEIAFDGVIPSAGVGNRDLCAILGNALDNAVEAAKQVVPCTVQVQAAVKPGGLVLTVRNPVRERVTIRGGTVQTSKKDKANHGFGIANIRRTAKKYDGYAEISCDDSAFTIEIGLLLKGTDAK